VKNSIPEEPLSPVANKGGIEEVIDSAAETGTFPTVDLEPSKKEEDKKPLKFSSIQNELKKKKLKDIYEFT
jgi:hypothetical protein